MQCKAENLKYKYFCDIIVLLVDDLYHWFGLFYFANSIYLKGFLHCVIVLLDVSIISYVEYVT